MLTDTVILDTIRSFLRSVDKPDDVTPLEILLIVDSIAHKAVDHPQNVSLDTLAKAFKVDWRTAQRTQNKLRKRGWLGLGDTYIRGKTLPLSANLNELPLTKLPEMTVTQDARRMVFNYKQCLIRTGKRKKFPKHWFEQQTYTCQKMLDDLGGDRQQLANLLTFAINNQDLKVQRRAIKGLYELWQKWPQLKAGFQEAQKAKGAA